ncbi:MAG: hypothetical protein AB7T06_40990 [Kofleriaceae bacterium]
MNRLVVVSLLAIVAACNSAPAAPGDGKDKPASKNPSAVPPKVAPPPKTNTKPAMHPIQVSWKLERQNNALELTYTVENTSDKPVVLLDRLYQTTAKGNLPLFDRAIVRDDTSEKTVSLVRGFVPAPPSVGIGNPTPPVARTLAPKEKVSDRATIPLPLASWHNFVRQYPTLRGAKTEAVFEVGYILGHDKWATIEMTDGSKQQTPSHPYVSAQVMWRSEPLAIP